MAAVPAEDRSPDDVDPALVWPDDAYELTAGAIRRRRHQLGLTQEAAAAKGGTVSVATWRLMESGRDPGHRFSGRTMGGVARALDWDIDWWQAVMRGQEPRPLPPDYREFLETHDGRMPEEELQRADRRSDALDFALALVDQGPLPHELRRAHETAWDETRQRVRERREELGLTIEEAAARANQPTATWELLETGPNTNFKTLTLAAASQVLGWPPEAIRRLSKGEPYVNVVEGGEPSPAEKLRQAAEVIQEMDVAFDMWLRARIALLSDNDRSYVQAVVDSLLEKQDPEAL